MTASAGNRGNKWQPNSTEEQAITAAGGRAGGEKQTQKYLLTNLHLDNSILRQLLSKTSQTQLLHEACFTGGFPGSW